MALVLFWRLASDLLAEVDSPDEARVRWDYEAAEALAWCRALEARVVAGEFPEAALAFDPADDGGWDWTRGAARVGRVANDMLRPAVGVDWRAVLVD